jgi:hypothetical protein
LPQDGAPPLWQLWGGNGMRKVMHRKAAERGA